MNVKPLRTKRDYEQALKQLEKVFDAPKGTTENDLAEVLLEEAILRPCSPRSLMARDGHYCEDHNPPCTACRPPVLDQRRGFM